MSVLPTSEVSRVSLRSTIPSRRNVPLLLTKLGVTRLVQSTNFVFVACSFLVKLLTSASDQTSGSTAVVPIYTPTVPLAKPPDPFNLEDRSYGGDNLLHFKTAWQISEQATGISKQDGPVRVAHFLNVIGREGVQLFDTFTFDEDSHESADNIDDVIAKFESRCLPQRNETYERYLFNKREQKKKGESVDQYCTALMRLSEQCSFMNLRDSSIRDRLILGVKNDLARKKLLKQKERSCFG